MNRRSNSDLAEVVEGLIAAEERKAEAAADAKDKWDEAKARGYSVPVLKRIVKVKRMDAVKRAAGGYAEMEFDTYAAQLDLFADTPHAAYMQARAKAAGADIESVRQSLDEARARAKVNEPLN